MASQVDFSNNLLGDRGVHQVLKVLYHLKIGVRVLKLFKNCLGRASASALMDWLVVTPIAVFELHLSHNFIPREGAVDIAHGRDERLALALRVAAAAAVELALHARLERARRGLGRRRRRRDRRRHRRRGR